jgi:glycosyltransferase involved in cell wall biosynthesis
MKNVCDAVVLPSVIEAFSLVLLEAAACGLPRIASACGGNVESIHDKQDGLLFRTGDTKDCADAMATLATDRTYGELLGEEARRRVIEQFSPSIFLDKFFQMYSELDTTVRRSRRCSLAEAALSMMNLAWGFKFGGGRKKAVRPS